MELQWKLRTPDIAVKYLLLFLGLALAFPVFAEVTYNGRSYSVDGLGPVYCMKREMKSTGLYILVGTPVGSGGAFEQWEDRSDGSPAPVIVTALGPDGQVVSRDVKQFDEMPAPMQELLTYLATTPSAQATCGQ